LTLRLVLDTRSVTSLATTARRLAEPLRALWGSQHIGPSNTPAGAPYSFLRGLLTELAASKPLGAGRSALTVRRSCGAGGC